jgi:hypothetical protein
MPAPIQTIAKEAYMSSLQKIFVLSIPFVGVSFLFSLMLANKRLTKASQGQHAPAMI